MPNVSQVRCAHAQPQRGLSIATGSALTFVAALLDPIPFSLGVHWLSREVQIDPTHEHTVDVEALTLEQAS